MSESKKRFKEVELDEGGKFKYIQIKIVNKKDPNDSRIILRGYKKCKFHDQIYKTFMENANVTLDDPYNYEVVGGGKIEFKEDNKKIYLSGQSTVYGPCDHFLSMEIIKKNFGDKYSIEIEKNQQTINLLFPLKANNYDYFKKINYDRIN